MRGFTLVEVLIASFIIMISVTGFVTLQSEYIKSDKTLNLRAAALQLADEKVDDLEQFDVLETQAGARAFVDIDDDEGGTLAAGVTTVNLKQGEQATHQFTRSWDVTNQYLVDTDADGEPDTWVDEGNPGVPVPAPAVPGRKLVAVTISWQDQNGDNQSVAVDASLAPVLTSRSFRANNEVTNSKIQPQVKYTPGAAPDVIAYELGNGETIETSKPVPDIDNQGENNVVKFETVRYIDLPEEADKLEQEDFLTVNCSCELAGTGEGREPNRTVFNGDDLVVEPGQVVEKTVGRAISDKPAICNQCCRDHHDTQAMVDEEHYYRKELGGPHKHYKLLNDGTYSLASAVGDPYDEVCRFKRVDGYYELYPDWQLVDIIEFRDNYLLNADKLTGYTSYTESVVKAAVNNAGLPAKPADRDLTLPPGGYQMISRGIYVDYMTAEHRQAIQDMITAGREDWKAFVPFYDINLTLLSSWDSTNKVFATVTNEEIKTILDPANDFYGTYSRGRLEALDDGVSTVRVAASRSNSGITGTPAISPDELASVLSDDSVTLTVNSKSASEKFYALIANINCVITVNGETQPCETNNDKKASYVDLTRLTIAKDPNQFNCAVNIPKGKSTPFFSCNNISENYRGVLTFGFSKPNFTVEMSVRMPNGDVLQTNELRLSGLDGTSTQEYELIINLQAI